VTIKRRWQENINQHCTWIAKKAVHKVRSTQCNRMLQFNIITYTDFFESRK
jgi:hypothetical protein